MTSQDQAIADFIARKGVTKIAEGVAVVQGRIDTSKLPSENEWLWEMGFQQEAQNRARGR